MTSYGNFLNIEGLFIVISVKPVDSAVNMLPVSLGTNVYDTNPLAQSMSFADLARTLVEHWHAGKLTFAEYQALRIEDKDHPRIKADKSTRYVSLAAFNGGRANENVVSLSGLVGDFDGGIRIEDIHARLAGYVYLIHTTYSNSAEHPKFRLILPYATPVIADDHRRLFAWFNSSAVFNGALDAAASDPARLSYFPSYCADQRGEARSWYQPDGRHFDAVTALASLPPVAPTSVHTNELTDEPCAEWSGPTDDAALIKKMLDDRRPKAMFGAKVKFRDLWERNVEKLAEAWPADVSGKEFNGSSADQSLCNLLAFWTGCHGTRMATLLRASGLMREKMNREDYIARTISKACAGCTKVYSDKVTAGTVKVAASDAQSGTVNTLAPWPTARSFLVAQFKPGEYPELKCWNKEFYQYQRGIYVPVSTASIRARLYPYLEAAGENPTPDNVSSVIDALASGVYLNEKIKVPSVIDAPDRDMSAVVVCRNSAWNLDTNERIPLSPNLFALNALPFDYDPNAPEPVEFLKFLATQWADDPQSINALQEIGGLLLTPVTRFQKLFFLIGPRRSGKGTILRIWTEMLGGIDNVVGPTLASLTELFGLQPLIGKLAAFIGDVRLSPRVDQSKLVERLLSLTGEDALSVPRKNTTDWGGGLFARLVMASNELPHFSDASGAAAGRVVMLVMENSFYDREDTGLLDRLKAELPQILAWHARGRRRLFERGHFVQPDSARETIKQLEELGQPVNVFIRDCCTVGPGLQVAKDDLFAAWRTHCLNNGVTVGSSATFGRDLLSSVTGIKAFRPLDPVAGKQFNAYKGIALTSNPTASAIAASAPFIGPDPAKIDWGNSPTPPGCVATPVTKGRLQ